jgi:hypothetical protein
VPKNNEIFKQEGHDGPEVAHLYIVPPEQGQFKPQGFYLNKIGRHPLEDVSCLTSKV